MRLTLAACHTQPSPQAVPLANAFLASYLHADPELADRLSISLCDLYANEPVAEGVASLAADRPDAVGFSLYVWNREWCREAIRQLRLSLPELIIFVGGPEATADPAGVLAETGCDFLVVGEGERPLREAMGNLLQGIPVAGVPGIATLQEGALVYTPAPALADLDSIPSPLLNGLLPAEDYTGFLWQHSRGCDFACDFCFDAKERRGVRRFSLDRLQEELHWLVRHQVSQVFVLDSTFNQDMHRAKEILRLIGEVAPHIHFHFEVRHEFIDEELADLFAAITCSLQIGLQSCDTRVMREVRRVFNPADFIARIMLLNESGAVFGFDLIYGLPTDTLDGFRKSLDFALALYPNHLDIFPLAVLPGTALAGRSEAIGLDHLTAPPYTLIGSPTFSAADMAAARDLATTCDLFYSRGKAVAWFNSICQALDLAPVALLDHVRDWLAARPAGLASLDSISDREIWQLQRDALSKIFASHKRDDLLPVALDLVDYHYHFAAALLATPPELPTDRELAHMELLDIPWQLGPATQLATFHYEILELLETGAPDLQDFSDCFSPSGSWAAIYPRAGEVFTESLIEPYYLLLQQLDGSATARSIIAGLEVPPDEASSFLEFAAAEGIITLPPHERTR